MLLDKEDLNVRVSRVCSTALGETISGRCNWASSFRAVAEGNNEFWKNVAVEWVGVS
jgi:hypothetical protein